MSPPAPSPSVHYSSSTSGAVPDHPARRDRWWAFAPVGSLVVLIAVLWVGAAVADTFPTEEVTWGFMFGAFILTVFYAPLPLLATLVTGFIGALSSRSSTVRIATVIGAVVASLCGAAALVVGGEAALTDQPADRVFGLSFAAGGLVPLATVLLLRKRARR